MNPIDEKAKRDISVFEHRFAEWLRLRGEKARLDLEEYSEAGQARCNQVATELDDVERLLMTTCACVPWMVWLKFEVLEQAIIRPDGGRTDHGEVWMLAGIKADLLALGFTDMEVGRGAGDAGREVSP